ncbi:hypothetical protein VTO42DRAFT_6009 [Malbranchea cinnamomea]
MFQSFTGNSRRPRQVNLSSRPSNPFTASSKRYPPSGSGAQAAIALAQQERIQRQLDRGRITASSTIQRVWRGYRIRKAVRSLWRNEWDAIERGRNPDYAPVCSGFSATNQSTSYSDASICISQLRLLLHFIEARNLEDTARLAYFAKSFQKTVEGIPSLAVEQDWTGLFSRLAALSLRVLATVGSPSPYLDSLLELLIFLTNLIPRQIAHQSAQYYKVMASLTTKTFFTEPHDSIASRTLLIRAILSLLAPITPGTLDAYEWFARLYLTIPSLNNYLGTIDNLAAGLNYKLLASALETNVLSDEQFLYSNDVDGRLWLLSYFVYFHRHALGERIVSQAPESLFVRVVSALLSSTSIEISQRIDLESPNRGESAPDSSPLPSFVQTQILSLVNQSNITHLLSHVGSGKVTDDAKSLATYALTLLRVFPRKADEIRMWLYLGSAEMSAGYRDSVTSRLPAIKYFWQASKSTKIYCTIVSNPDEVLDLLRAPLGDQSLPNAIRRDREQEWTVILLFLELYTFLLKVLDDEEFFSGGYAPHLTGDLRMSWTKESTLPLDEVKNLTIFLKNLAFTLYWNAADLISSEPTQPSVSLSDYFNPSAALRAPASTTKSRKKDLVIGTPLDYLKGLVTGLLRMVHERDSRRKFLPDGHWLMTDRFDMEGFIPAVVAEEENRHQLQDEDEDSEVEDEEMEDVLQQSLGLVGTGRAQQVRRIELLKKRQQQAARKKELEAIAPRLEILRNIPFFIPFSTRVQIFREFILRDQLRRRNGFVDPDAWRLSVAQNAMGLTEDGRPIAHDILSKHHANIRRTNLFEDAFRQFYPLGEGLKEPIQITFIDQFDTVEAGIDGGGVTKEFLTSIINDAFSPSGPLSLFSENDQHLLYPNPTAVEQRKYLLREAGIPERSPEWNDQIRELLKRYEFLGRIIGKCLYEGILVDVNFAPFFLLKWALTGGSGSASKESSYRANLNDVRDLDEGLYQGLLQLKNYPGDVEDFALNFTITDTIAIPDMSRPEDAEKSITITRDLKPNGSEIPVTNQNRLVYISYIARHRLQAQPYLQTNAFLQGLGQMIQPSWLSMFNQGELQTLIGGDACEIDVEDLRRNTLYSGVYVMGEDNEEHPTVKMFWDVLRSMSNEDRQKVLKFVTSTPRAPLLGFSHLRPRFSIRDSSGDEDRLPSTSTCANLLKLPRYTSAKTLREKLMYAINAGAGFDLS